MAEASGGYKPTKGGKDSKPNASNALERTRGNKGGKDSVGGGNPKEIGQETVELSKSVEKPGIGTGKGIVTGKGTGTGADKGGIRQTNEGKTDANNASRKGHVEHRRQ